MNKLVFCSTSIFALSVGSLACAQQAAPQEGIAEVIVTAQRKSESLQSAAIAVEAATGEDLARQGVNSAADLTKMVPEISVNNGGGQNTSLFMRGVGNRTNNSYADAAIATSYDGVYLGRASGAFGAAFYDLARVEVLMGPQGILYGRNATGGAVNIIPEKPKLGATEGQVELGYGNYNTVDANGFVNLPVTGDSAFRFSATRQSHDGYNKDGTDDADTVGLRAQLLYEPDTDLSVRLAGDYSHQGGMGAGGTYLGNYGKGASGYVFTPSGLSSSEGFGTPVANAYRSTLLGSPGFGLLTPMNTAPSLDYTYWGTNLEFQANTPLGKLTMIPAYRETSGASYFAGPDFNTAYNSEADRQYSLETRLAGDIGRFDYIGGIYYINERVHSGQEFNQEFVLPIQHYTQNAESWAGFGQVTAHIADDLRLVGGARYTDDSKDMNGSIVNFITYCGGVPPQNLTPPASIAKGCAASSALPRYPNFLGAGDTINWLAGQGWISSASPNVQGNQTLALLDGKGAIAESYTPVVQSGSYSRTTWKLSGEYDLMPTSLLFATAETGYRAGGFQLAAGIPTYKPEYLDAYTIGSKNRFFGNRLQVNAEGFLWKYRDQQITYFTLSSNGTLVNALSNAGNATIKGADLDIVAKPESDTLVRARVDYLDSEYNQLHLYTAAPRDNINCPHSPTGQLAGGAPLLNFDCSGRAGLYSPRWTVNLGVEHWIALDDEYDLVGDVNTAWRAQQYGGFEYLPFERIAAYWKTDATLSLRNNDHNWSLTAYVLNLEDRREMTVPQLSPTGQATAVFGAPRTYGMRASYSF